MFKAIRKSVPAICYMTSENCIGIRYKNKHAVVTCSKHGWIISTSDGDRYEALGKKHVIPILQAEVAYCPKANGEGCYEVWCEYKRKQKETTNGLSRVSQDQDQARS